GSHVAGSPAAIERTQRAPARYYQRPDADHLALDPSRTSLSGLAGNVWASKIGGPGHWRWGVGGHFRTPGFEVNDIGFQRSADQALAFANLRY
ncbi:MAG: hydrolase, partial [Gammaproteobacteria bacterium]|nr:hydrolase [Gemmatimonadota bacterium]NIU73904.1 hydrolase [Gammaproteobacteria bacterium]NIX20542.1 hydrolase [Actinomycetota bacterium]